MNLSDAVKFGDLESIKVAINNGIPVNQRDKYYKTPLMIACLYGKINVAQTLLDMGWVINKYPSHQMGFTNEDIQVNFLVLVSIIDKFG